MAGSLSSGAAIDVARIFVERPDQLHHVRVDDAERLAGHVQLGEAGKRSGAGHEGVIFISHCRDRR